MVTGDFLILVFLCTVHQCLWIVNGITIAGDDPWYKKASYYWSFNTLQDRSVVDQRGTSSVPAYSKNGLQLDGFLDSWADLGNCSKHCISDPDSCKTGFTVTFWIRVNDLQRGKVIMQIASATRAVGTTVELNDNVLSVHVNNRDIQRNMQVKWPNSSWVFVALTWNKTENKIHVLLNATSVSYVKNTVGHNFLLASVLPYHTLILGANKARLRSTKMTVDELALWNGALSKKDLRYIMESKAVDGGFTNWSDFSSCTVSCGVGAKTRTRSCINPRPKHGGNHCLGSSTHTEKCFLRYCSINGNYSEWTKFSPCTLSCGGGKRYRNRDCTNPKPRYGGLNCSGLGPKQEIEDCNTHSCPINGGYSEWSKFGVCSVTCNSGRRIRARVCNNPSPQHGGRDCAIFGPENETLSCFPKACPVDGNYSNWSSFGTCSKSCGGGEKIRTRKCDNPAPVEGGRNCSRFGRPNDSQPCNTEPCPVSGGYTPWSDFSPCTTSCGGGTHFRRRTCTNPPPEAGGEDCTRLGPTEETALCNTKLCPVDGGYGEWSSFTPCSQTCGGGKKARSRNCNNPAPQNEGRDCSRLGLAREIQSCSTKRCPAISFLAPVTFPEETFNTDLLNAQSGTFKKLVERIKYNVYKIYDKNSALESIDVKSCGMPDKGNSGVQCVLQFGFMAERYTGVIALQDALTTTKLLHSMPVKTHFFSSNDVPNNAPENVKAQNTSSRSINVTWTKSKPRPHRVGGGDILGYRLLYMDEEGTAWNRLIPGENNTHTELKNMRIYTQYCVRIMAYNRRGDGKASNPVCAHTDKDVPDDAPPNVTARNLSATELLVEWNPLSEKYIHGVLMGYCINLTKDNVNFTKIVNIPPNATNYRITGLEKFTRYVIKMAAINDVGLGVYSDDVTVWTEEAVPIRAPNITDIFYTSSSSIRVNWEQLPQGYTLGRLLGYRVVYRRVAGKIQDNWKTITTGANDLGVAVTGLKKYGAYVIQVGAFTRKGNGVLSKGYMLRTDEDVPSKPPQNMTVAKDNSTSTSLFIHWRPVPMNHQNGIILGYRILYKTSTGQDRLRAKNVSAQSTATELKNLTKYTEYDITILAYTSKGNGVRARFFTVSTTEDRPSKPPTLTSVFNTSSTSIKVKWKPIPQEYTHGILVGFVVIYRAMNESQDMYRDIEVGPDRNGLELKGLWKYTKYEIRVLGFTRVGWGVISPEVIVQTNQDTPGRPPENVFAANKTTPTTIPVSWRPISNQYFVHGILRGYTVTYRAVKNPNKELEGKEKDITVGPNTLSVELHDLSSFTIYSIEVRAFTVKGNGTPSEVIFAETCNCYSKMYTNYWINAPYMDKDSSGNESGIFPPILRQVVRSCCGECAAHGYTKIDFRKAGDNDSAIKNTEKQVKEAIDDITELSFPVYGRIEQTEYSDEYGFAPLVQSAGVAFIVAGDEPGAAAKMVVKAVFDLWPLIITVFISAFFAGIVMWLLDFVFNGNQFPASPMRGPVEGMWWAFVTMTTVGYGDRVPRAIHSKLFGIVWITCGLVIIALLMSFITTSLTMDIIKSDISVYGSKVAAIDDSAEFRLGIRLNAKMDQERRYTTLEDLHKALKDRHVEGALIDSYTVGSRKELFSDGVLRVSKMIDYSSAYGVVMAGYARKLQKCFQGFLKEEKDSVFEIITDNVQGISGLQKNNAADKTEDLFDAESTVYIQTMTYCGVSMAVLLVICLIYELVTRKKRNPNPRRYEYSDYLQDVHKEDRLYEYNNSKETMKKILTDFHKNCRLRLENLKAKHRRELRLLARLKQEAADKGELDPIPGSWRSERRSFFGFTPQNSIVRYINGVVP